MNNAFERILKDQLAPEKEPETEQEGDAGVGGYRQTNLNPYDRLRRSLQRFFPGYPPIFDHNEEEKH